MKIGFFGGSFNPPTKAHLNLARKAIEEKNLDKVVFVPICNFYEKKELEPIDKRIEMLNILCKDEDKLEVSSIERDFKEKKYAIDVFKIIEQNYKNDDFYFLMGEDNFINLPNWKEFDLLKKYKYIVFERSGDIEKTRNDELMGIENKPFFIKNSCFKDISSTSVRSMIKNDVKIDNDIIDKDVEKYIYKNKLYL